MALQKDGQVSCEHGLSICNFPSIIFSSLPSLTKTPIQLIVDKIAKELPSSSCWVDWGGDIKVRGKHPAGRPWKVAVPEPPKLSEMRSRVAKAKKVGQRGPVYSLADEHMKDETQDDSNGKEKEYLAILELRDGEAVATSGDYESKNVETFSLLSFTEVIMLIFFYVIHCFYFDERGHRTQWQAIFSCCKPTIWAFVGIEPNNSGSSNGCD